MAEGIAALSLATSLFQIIDFSEKVLFRLKNFQSDLLELPDCFRRITTILPLITERSREIREAIDADNIEEERKSRLIPIIDTFKKEISKLHNIINRAIPKNSDDGARRVLKAFRSLSQDSKVNKISRDLEYYMNVVAFCFAGTPSSSKERKGNYIQSIFFYITLNNLR